MLPASSKQKAGGCWTSGAVTTCWPGFFWIGAGQCTRLSPTERLQNISGSLICRYLKLLRKRWRPAALKMLLLLTCRLSWNIFMNRTGCCLPSIKSWPLAGYSVFACPMILVRGKWPTPSITRKPTGGYICPTISIISPSIRSAGCWLARDSGKSTGPPISPWSFSLPPGLITMRTKRPGKRSALWWPGLKTPSRKPAGLPC